MWWNHTCLWNGVSKRNIRSQRDKRWVYCSEVFYKRSSSKLGSVRSIRQNFLSNRVALKFAKPSLSGEIKDFKLGGQIYIRRRQRPLSAAPACPNFFFGWFSVQFSSVDRLTGDRPPKTCGHARSFRRRSAVFFNLLHPRSAGSSSSAFTLRSVVRSVTGSSVHGQA